MFHVKHSKDVESGHLLRNREEKIARAAHIKRNTEGTSNEISFSVLDAAKNAMDSEGRDGRVRGVFRLGSIPLFTLGRGKKPISTPSKDKEITIPSESAGSSVPSGTSTSSNSSSAFGPSGTSGPSASSGSLGASSPSSADRSQQRALAAEVSERASNEGSEIKSGTPPVVTHAAWETPLDEVARRKSKRRRYKLMVAATFSLIVVGLIAGGVLMLYQGFQDQQDKKNQLISLASEVGESNERYQPFYEIVEELTQTSLEQIDLEDMQTKYTNLTINIDDEKGRLEQTKASVEALEKEFADPNDSEAANQALAGIIAHINMLDAGDKIARDTLSSKEVYDLAEEAWQKVLDADALARDAASLASEASVDNMQKSTEKSNESLALFYQAGELLESVQTKQSNLDFDEYLDYINLRIDAQEQALTSNQAYIDRDKDTLSEATNSYNELEEQAAALAKSFTGGPSDLVAQLLDGSLEETIEAYRAEKLRALDSDTFLSDYLGSSIK